MQFRKETFTDGINLIKSIIKTNNRLQIKKENNKRGKKLIYNPSPPPKT